MKTIALAGSSDRPRRAIGTSATRRALFRGLALMPAYAKNLLPPSVVSRPLEGEAPTIDIAVGYSKSNTSPVLELFLSRLDELVRLNPRH
jgi:hypothetical protein